MARNGLNAFSANIYLFKVNKRNINALYPIEGHTYFNKPAAELTNKC